MTGLAITVLLGACVLLASVLSPRVRVPAPLLLVVTGLLLGLSPSLREVELPPEVVLLLFLPVILFWESLTTSLRAIRRDLRGILILSTLLVAATAGAVTWVAHQAGLSWEAAFILGAALAPPDATAATALGRLLPARQFMLLKAESLTNDGTALVLYAIAVGLATGERYTAAGVAGLLVLSYVGGVVAGVLVAGAAYLGMKRLHDATLTNVALLLAPFVAYLLAEEVGASGVLAVVTTGLLLSFGSGRISTAASRRQTESTWPLGTLLLNGALFVLIGLETTIVAVDLDPGTLARLGATAVAVWLTLLVVRFAFPQLVVVLIRTLDRRPEQRARRMSHRARVVSAVAGFRGAVSLAIALSVPAVGTDGGGVPARDDIVVICATVVVLTLLVQGPLLPMAIRWARLPEDRGSEEELQLAETQLVRAALDALPEAARQLDLDAMTADRLRDHYAARLPTDGQDPALTAQSLSGEEQLHLALVGHKRSTLATLRRSGTIDDAVARVLQTRLDVEELRLRGVDPPD